MSAKYITCKHNIIKKSNKIIDCKDCKDYKYECKRY